PVFGASGPGLRQDSPETGRAGSGRCRLRSPELAERNEPLTSLVPQRETGAADALDEADKADLPELGVMRAHRMKAFERHPAADMVDMGNADIAGDPGEHQ